MKSTTQHIASKVKELSLILGLILLTTLGAVAQNDTTDLPEIPSVEDDSAHYDDTTKIKLKHSRILIISNKDSLMEDLNDDDDDDDHKNKFWSGIEIGINGYADKNNSLGVPGTHEFLELDYGKSINWNLNIWEQDIRLVGEYVKLITGLGFEFNHYAFKNNTTLIPGGDSIWAFTDTVANFDRNKLKTTYLTAPLMIGISTSEDKRKAFRIAGGMILGYRIGSRLKQKYELGDDTFRPKVASAFNTSPFKYSATARVGYGRFTLYGNYALNSLFEDGEGPELHPFSVGIRVLPF